MAMRFCYLKYNNLQWNIAWNYIIYSHPLAASAAASSYPCDICVSDLFGDKNGIRKTRKNGWTPPE